VEHITPEIESKKRKKEILIAICLGVLFLILTFIEVRLTYLSRELPFMHSIFFFGLVNFNIVLLLFLAFLVFRNVVKTFVERSGKIIGSSLKSKLIAAFVTFSFVPTVLMFFISVFYINSSFDKWFSIKTSAVLRDSLEITNSYYLTSKQKNYHFANQIIKEIQGKSEKSIEKELDGYRSLYSLDVVEFYPGLFGDRSLYISDNKTIPDVPKASLEFLEKGIKKGTDASTLHHFQDGSLIRVIAPLNYANARGENVKGALVVSTFVPISLISKMDEIAAAYDNFKDINPLVYPIKTIYLVILCLMTMVIMLGATWFGFYLAKQLATPLATLGEAADQIAQGNYEPVNIQTGSQEINQLVKNFNSMTTSLAQSEKEILEANKNLKSTLDTLDEHNRYIEVILSNVSAGVVSIDFEGTITTMNPKAAHLLRIPADRYVGMSVLDALTGQNRETYREIVTQMKKNNFKTLQKELRIQIQEDSLLMKLTITMLKDEKGSDLGFVIVFDDLTELVNAQRASAWREVARRIAHEIKNPLTPIKLSAQRLEKKFGAQVQDPAFQACTDMIIKQVDELKNLVNEFSSFARLPQISPKLGSLNSIIEESLVLYSTGHKEMQFNFYPDANLPYFEFDQEQIKRVVTNLLENAIDALKDAETPKIEIVTVFDAQLGIVKTRIKDNGCGIESDMRDRIFEPYFSTRENGTGLGLAIVKRIIEDHHGFIRAFSNQPKGTEFVIELPVVRLKKTGAEDNREFENKA
jgi:two-component system nitrogen regulation sensor histidine kinase NtrY